MFISVHWSVNSCSRFVSMYWCDYNTSNTWWCELTTPSFTVGAVFACELTRRLSIVAPVRVVSVKTHPSCRLVPWSISNIRGNTCIVHRIWSAIFPIILGWLFSGYVVIAISESHKTFVLPFDYWGFFGSCVELSFRQSSMNWNTT